VQQKDTYDMVYMQMTVYEARERNKEIVHKTSLHCKVNKRFA